MCEKRNGLWLCLTCGHVACSRPLPAPFQDQGGNGHALVHALATSHPCVVKIGTLATGAKASCYCYTCDDDRVDPLLLQHTMLLGLPDVRDFRQTELTTEVLERQLNQEYVFSTVWTEEQVRNARAGPGFVGIRNLGNTCYQGSVLQCVLRVPGVRMAALPELWGGPAPQERYEQCVLVRGAADARASLSLAAQLTRAVRDLLDRHAALARDAEYQAQYHLLIRTPDHPFLESLLASDGAPAATDEGTGDDEGGGGGGDTGRARSRVDLPPAPQRLPCEFEELIDLRDRPGLLAKLGQAGVLHRLPTRGLSLRILRQLVTWDHPEFAGSGQQDAYEFLEYLFRAFEHLPAFLTELPSDSGLAAFGMASGALAAPFTFVVEQRLTCTHCRTVRVRRQQVTSLSVAIPQALLRPRPPTLRAEARTLSKTQDAPINPPEAGIQGVPFPSDSSEDTNGVVPGPAPGDGVRDAGGERGSTAPTEVTEPADASVPEMFQVALSQCLEAWANPEGIEGVRCPACSTVCLATHTERLVTFPSCLVICLRRQVYDDHYRPVKLRTAIVVPGDPHYAAACTHLPSGEQQAYWPSTPILDVAPIQALPLEAGQAIETIAEHGQFSGGPGLGPGSHATPPGPKPAAASPGSSSGFEPLPGFLQSLVLIGFSAEQATEALRAVQNASVGAALDVLLSGTVGSSGSGGGGATTTTTTAAPPRVPVAEATPSTQALQLVELLGCSVRAATRALDQNAGNSDAAVGWYFALSDMDRAALDIDSPDPRPDDPVDSEPDNVPGSAPRSLDSRPDLDAEPETESELDLETEPGSEPAPEGEEAVDPLDLATVEPDLERSQYTLVAFTNHQGQRLTSGHYIATCRESFVRRATGTTPPDAPLAPIESDPWIVFNDSVVFQTARPTMDSSYLLFFERL